MSIFAIGDLHLSFGHNKPMDIFGDNWLNYEQKIKENWENTIKENDTVIIPGDISWAMYLEETVEDFKFIDSLPGKKIFLKGNHDYWWETATKMKNFLKANKFNTIDILYNNSIEVENSIICGTRLWGDIKVEEDKAIYRREKMRLELSLKSAKESLKNDEEIIVATHYPPDFEDEELMEILKKYDVKKYIYGHLHRAIKSDEYSKIVDGIEFNLVSCDYLDFMPLKIN